MTPALTIADFEPFLGHLFASAQGELRLETASRAGEAPAPLPAPFTLEFSGPPGLAQGIHDLTHPTLGTLGIFLVPLAPTRYEAVFG